LTSPCGVWSVSIEQHTVDGHSSFNDDASDSE